jgi:hypothetical protein
LATVDSSATVNGTSPASAAAIVCIAIALTFQGTASFTGVASVGQLASGTFLGDSTFEWNYFVDTSAVVAGSSDASANGNVRVGARGVVVGTSLFLYNAPLVIQGDSHLSILPVIDHHPPPLRAITLGPKTFRWLQTLQRGDLPVFLSDRHRPMVPFRVTYSLAQIRSDGSRKYVGPRHRLPVAGEVGEFYATGRAGETGQSGQWFIEWSVQRTSQSIPEVTEMRFQVLDAAAVGDPRDLLDRKIKFGWS